MHSISVEVEAKSALTVVALKGCFENEAAERLQEVMDPLVAKGDKSLLVDASDAYAFDMVASAVILSCSERLRRDGRELIVCGAPESLTDAFHDMNMAEGFEFYADRFSALLSFFPGDWLEINEHTKRSGQDRRAFDMPIDGQPRSAADRREAVSVPA
jgi:anti-anti-sigma regulatory factor